ncbi:MAG: aminoglycoside phosphotransferase family protein [Rickettsiales bacterium]|jgi:serine/threonine protein kinase|nr:aminoglycoside phosphotransferase family protein [Rickettsiales bacterium]
MINNQMLWEVLKKSPEFLASVGGDFEYVETYLSGRNSYSFKIHSLTDTNKNFVVKSPLQDNPIYQNWWRIACKKENAILEKIDYEKVSKFVQIPRVEIMNIDGFDVSLNTYVSGESFTRDMYDSFNRNVQKKIANDIAKFLSYLHSLPPDDFWQFGLEDGKCMLNQVDNCSCIYKKSRTEFLEFFNSFFDDDLMKFFDAKMRAFDSITDMHSKMAFIHNDLRESNILYDVNHQSVGIIDFGEGFVASNITAEFANMAKVNQLGFDFTNDVIDAYNEISAVKVDKKDLAVFACLASLHDNRNIHKMASEKQIRDVKKLKDFAKEVDEYLDKVS